MEIRAEHFIPGSLRGASLEIDAIQSDDESVPVLTQEAFGRDAPEPSGTRLRRLRFQTRWFDLVLEADCREGQIIGYIKPLFRNLEVFSFNQALSTIDKPR